MPARIIFPERHKVSLEEFDVPRIKNDQIRVRTLFSLMSIGTETIILHQKYDPDTHFAKMFSFPQLKTGVQAIGEVEETGKDVSDIEKGKLVFMRQAHGSHQVLAAADSTLVPEFMNPRLACWCGLAKTAFRASWAGGFNNKQHVLVIGAGPVGQMTLRWAASENVKSLAVADLAESRLAHAENGGASHLFAGDLDSNRENIATLNSGAGPDLIVDTTGNAAVFIQALGLAARFGKIILLGDTGYPSRQCMSSDVMTKGLTIQATHDSHDRDGWTQRKVDALFFQRVHEGSFRLDELITHEFIPEQCVEAYSQADERRNETMGVLFDWTQREY